MDTDQEGFLAANDSDALLNPSLARFNANNNNIGNATTRWRKNACLILILLSIAGCLTIYLYLNMVAIDGNQIDSSSRYKPLSRRKPMLDHESIFSDSGPSMIRLSDLVANCIVALRIAGRQVVNLSLAHNDKLHQVGSKGKTLEGADDIVTGADIKSHQLILNTIKDSYRRLKVISEEDTTKNFEHLNAEDDILPINRTEFAQLIRSDLHDIEGQFYDKVSLIAQHETLVWIDPLDATKEYSENLTNYVTLMACVVHKSLPIAGVIHKPFTNETFWSMLDIPTGKYRQSSDLHKALMQSKGREKTDRVRIIVSRSHAGDVKDVLESAYGQRADIIAAGGSGYKTIELIRGRADAYLHLTHIKKWDICAPNAILSSISGGKMSDSTGDLITFGEPKDTVVTKGLVASLDSKLHEDLIRLTGGKKEKNPK